MGSSPKAPKKTASQIRAEKKQAAEDSRTSEELNTARKASYRSRRGKASLISGDEQGITDKTLLG